MGDAYSILEEAISLRAASDRGEVKLAQLEGDIFERVRRAVKLAPSDPDVLLLAVWLLGPFCVVNPSIAKTVRKMYAALDAMGGPREQTLAIAGWSSTAYAQERARRV